ncbi:hypothetical protein RQP46_010503 [Phenoliferia psychrophenolica]
MLPSFPYEITHKILKLATLDLVEEERRHSSLAGQTNTFLHLSSLVSHTWRNIAQPLLLRHGLLIREVPSLRRLELVGDRLSFGNLSACVPNQLPALVTLETYINVIHVAAEYRPPNLSVVKILRDPARCQHETLEEVMIVDIVEMLLSSLKELEVPDCWRSEAVELAYEVITAYSHSLRPVAQHQHLPGLDGKMNPVAEWTRLEQWDNDGKPFLAEYVGSGKLAGKSCLVTGGDSGIGRSAAVMFAREGADVSIVYQPEEQPDAEEVRKSIEAAGRRCLLLPGDLCNRAFCEEVVTKHVKEFGGLNVLVNNAAKQGMEPDIGNQDLDFVELTFRTNILAIFAVTKFAVPHMKRGSSIINSTSVGAYFGHAMAAKLDYSSTSEPPLAFTA